MHEYRICDALSELKAAVQSTEPRGVDWRLNALLAKYPSRNNIVLSDTGFVFGTLDSREDAQY